jgi:hypothetical protein
MELPQFLALKTVKRLYQEVKKERWEFGALVVRHKLWMALWKNIVVVYQISR